MASKKIFVVGDKFHEFTNGKDVLTISQLELLTQIPAKLIDTEHEVIVGQGVREDFAKKIIQDHKNNTVYNNKLNIQSLEDLAEMKKNCYSHKKINQNVLIGSANKVEHNDSHYVLPLIIDERCELMSDHQTGQHIQGMLLVEACRQTFIAVTEEFFFKDQSNKYYVINSMGTNFSSFLFPLPALVHYEILEKDIDARRARFKAQLSVTQGETLCATMDVSFTVYPSEIISCKESKLAAIATDVALASARQTTHRVSHA
ncbi:AfsA-related hotdog domain-containing protein [Xenorhabdus khoisanae]|uniref:AfsA-related hotdog domain-containing protein n=1 Tax=Xenorhabdus khoisanae TaxID=880157 RepID=UPI002358E0C1|nr:AfsA-related hotdog domain-containing protein [Xenorhabdus khoisanae]MDC9613718.1 AfsA-related hotdog domain-containing protein [Xenorhabdus khoisanae]